MGNVDKKVKSANGNLPENIAQLQAIVAQQMLQLKIKDEQIEFKDEQIDLCKEEIEILKEHLRLARAARFASQSEKLPSEQSEMFDEVEVLAQSVADEVFEDGTIEVPAHSRKRGKREPLPENLPRVEVVIDLSEAEKICVKDGTRLKEIGVEVSEQLDVVPMRVTVTRTIRKKYICECCDEKTNIKTAAMPERILPKSNATAGLLAYIATAKYVDALPMYRQEEILKRYGVEIPRNTMCRWMMELTEKLQPIYDVMESELVASDYICCDETRVQVLKEENKKAEEQSYMWVRTRHGPKINPIVLFEYDPTRRKEVANDLLKNFKGYLQADGYAGYDAICNSPEITRVGCMAHVRRKFFETHKVSKKSGGEAHRILKLIQKLYEVESEIKEKSIDERKKVRDEKATPILSQIKTWLDANKNKHPPQGLMGKAITYATNQWEFVMNYLKDGRIAIDNNFTENRIRPFAIGRKNWLFSNSVNGAKASAMLYSILQTARGNGLEPYAYMRHLLTELPKYKTPEQIANLAPHKIDFKILN